MPFFFKQWGEWAPLGEHIDSKTTPLSTPVCLVKHDGTVVRPYRGLDGPGAEMVRIGLKRAGDRLASVEHKEFPEVSR